MDISTRLIGHLAPLVPAWLKGPAAEILRQAGLQRAAPGESSVGAGPLPSPEYCDLEYLVTDENFAEAAYLAAHPDVARAVAAGWLASGHEHFLRCGKKEQRRIRLSSSLEARRAEKLRRLTPLLRRDLPHQRRGLKYDFLTAELRAESGISETSNVSAHGYDSHIVELIQRHRNGMVLDCGAGMRPRYYNNVVNYEIVDYDTTDVLGVGEQLPFRDQAFDGVISIAVLEHVRDPFRCAKELVRVLKPGGQLICSVPFLQPLHGYPHHYYNMSHQGLRALFERSLVIDDHQVLDHMTPIWSLTWFVQSWAAGLAEAEREEFLNLPLRTLMAPAGELLDAPWVKQLPTQKRFELASATELFAHKPPAAAGPLLARLTGFLQRGKQAMHHRLGGRG